MVEQLKRTYFKMLLPALAGIILVRLNKIFQWSALETIQFPQSAGAILFVLAVASAVALPLFLRGLFAHRVRDQKTVSRKVFLRFQHQILVVVLMTPYLVLIAQLAELPRFFMAGTVLMALYGLYFHYPHHRRINFDRRMFKVTGPEPKDRTLSVSCEQE